MRHLLAATAFVALASGTASATQERYVFDPTHTNILFFVSHFGFSTMKGEFTEYDGELVLDRENPENSAINVTIETASLDTGLEARDNHLRNPDFFNVDEHPTMTFESTEVSVVDDNRAEVVGELTILGETQPVSFDVELNGLGELPIPPQPFVAGFDAATTIDRTAFGMDYGAPAIGTEVEIRISTEMHRQ